MQIENFFGPSYFMTTLVNIKSKWKIKSNFVAFSENLNFIINQLFFDI